MYWYERPPWIRWAAAAALVAAAFAFEMSPDRMEPRPFAARPVAAGNLLQPEDIEWRRVPEGLFAMPDLSLPAAVDLEPGDPITTPTLAEGPAVPAGWWSVPVELPAGVAAGEATRLVVADSGMVVDGVVLSPPVDDPFTVGSMGLVAVPGEAAAAVAAAELDGDLVVLVAP